jgi:hypothetical protein
MLMDLDDDHDDPERAESRLAAPFGDRDGAVDHRATGSFGDGTRFFVYDYVYDYVYERC